MQRLLLSHQRHLWQQTGSCARFVTKDSNGIKTCSCTDVGTTFHGNSGKGPVKKSGKGSTSALSLRVFIMILHVLLEILQGLKNIFVESTERRSGSVTSAPSDMLFSPIGRLTPRLVAPGSIGVTVGPCFLGEALEASQCSCTYLTRKRSFGMFCSY